MKMKSWGVLVGRGRLGIGWARRWGACLWARTRLRGVVDGGLGDVRVMVRVRGVFDVVAYGGVDTWGWDWS